MISERAVQDGGGRVRSRRYTPTKPRRTANKSAAREEPLSSSILRVSPVNLGAPSLNGQKVGRQERKQERGIVDDDLVGLLADTADQDQIARFLNSHLGIGRGRARKQAARATMTPAIARQVAALDHGQQIGNRGAYFAGLIDEALAEAATDHQRRQREQADEASRDLADALEAIAEPDRVPNAELAALAEDCRLGDFVGGMDALRTDPACKRELANEWLATQIARTAPNEAGEIEIDPDDGAPGGAGALPASPLHKASENA